MPQSSWIWKTRMTFSSVSGAAILADRRRPRTAGRATIASRDPANGRRPVPSEAATTGFASKVRPTAWSVDAVCELFELPFNDLIYRAHGVHREQFPPNAVQLSTLLSIKTGGCPEDCKYCPQSARY